jgi:mannan endo-1,4-beta-mannosidase
MTCPAGPGTTRKEPPCTRAAGVAPQIVGIYARFGGAFPSGEVREILATGALPLIGLNPRSISLAAIASGRHDRLLRACAAAIHKLGRPVAISFGHEASGPWYPWGCRQAPARAYVAAWRHIHDVTGTRMVTWAWMVNRTWKSARCHLRARWPGPGYVSWVGIDGYLRGRALTFRTVFGPTLRQLRTFARKPVLITETGVPPGPPQAARNTRLCAASHAAGLAGLVWFDANAKQRWRIDDDPSALAVFRRAARSRE